MSGTRISPEAFSKLRELSKWVHGTQKFEQELTHLSRCVDEDRHAKIRPLLKELGFDIKGHGYKIWRISGKVPINKASNYRSLFFPLSVGSGPDSIASGELQIDQETLTPGSYVTISRSITVDGPLDCLIVLLPDPANPPTRGE